MNKPETTPNPDAPRDIAARPSRARYDKVKHGLDLKWRRRAPQPERMMREIVDGLWDAFGDTPLDLVRLVAAAAGRPGFLARGRTAQSRRRGSRRGRFERGLGFLRFASRRGIHRRARARQERPAAGRVRGAIPRRVRRHGRALGRTVVQGIPGAREVARAPT